MNVTDDAHDRVRKLLSGPLPEASDAAVGRRLGKYAIIRELGRGGMGSVYEAEDPDLHRRVALKVLREVPEGSTFVDRLHREASILAQLRHPNVAVIYEVAAVTQPDGRPAHFIAMEYVDGRTLAEVLSEGRTPVRKLVEMLETVARAAAFAHSKSVIHRDLKPANVLVEKSGRLVLTDFGLARADAFDSRLTRTQAVIGTPLYMAPEQVGGRTRDIGPRTDVYALGVILYEMLAGRPPFTAPTPAELYQQILAGDPAHPSRHGRSVDHELELVALKALSKERELRYASATEFADDLARWLRGERVTARPAGIAYRLRRALARRAGIVAGLVVALLVAAAAVPWGLAQGRKRDEEARLREAQERELAATRELGTLWSDVLVARQAFLNPSTDPARVRSGLLAIVDRVSAYIDRYPSRPQGWYVRARARLLIGDLSEAEGDLRRALEIDAGFSPGEALLARILLERHALQNFGDPFHADETARKSEHLLLEARRHLDRSLRDAATDRWGLPRTPDDEATEVLCRAMVTAYVEKDVARASTMLAEADARYPSEEYAHWRGIWSTDPRERMELLSLSITRMPHHARVRVDRGFERIGRGDHDGALEDLRAALAINPRIRGANENLAHALFAMGDPDAAIEVCDRILATQPSNVSLRILRGLARMKKGDADGAREDFDHAVATSPDTAQAWSNRGMVRASQGDEEGALADYAKAIELSPRLMGARENRGTLRLKRGAFADAIADFDVAIEMNPRSANALYRRAAARASLWQASRVNDRSELRKVRDDLDRAFAAAPEKWMARVAAEELDSWLRMMERDE